MMNLPFDFQRFVILGYPIDVENSVQVRNFHEQVVKRKSERWGFKEFLG